MRLVARHVDFVEALRGAGIGVSLAEDLDAVAALSAVSWSDRATVREVYAATLVKRRLQRPTFDMLFDLWWPPVVGRAPLPDQEAGGDGEGEAAPSSVKDGPTALEELRDRLAEALAAGDQRALSELAVEAVERFGEVPGREPGASGWSAYTTLRRVAPQELVDGLLAGLSAGRTEDEARRDASRRVGGWVAQVEADARRRIAEVKGPAHLADVAVRPGLDLVDFTSARADELARMRREIQPLARRLATRLAREQRSRRRGPLDVRRTVRASLPSGGVPLVTHHRPRRPHRSELVVLCDVSGSVAGFASFTLLLVFALREQFERVRAFTFVDRVHEVTHHFRPDADPGQVLAALAASSAHAARVGRTDYGAAFRRFLADHTDAIGPRTSLLVLGDARSNYADLALPALRELAGAARQSWWLNPEHRRHWGTGDSAAGPYGEVVPMWECRNLTQLGDLVHDLV